MDDDTGLRSLETKYKLRVKTGCETCRIRRVKCDETKPACLRCTKTGRKCSGYERVEKPKKGRYAEAIASASFRNPGFLVVPQRIDQSDPSRCITQSLSENPLEVRSFKYFQSRTLPNWTEYFDSDLWSRKVLQLSHAEPAIKHGILALSVMHERFENGLPVFTTERNDVAFMQYAAAVKHSNRLLEAYMQGDRDLEMVLVACIIFTCYEHLAANFKGANMHLRNGLRILQQYRRSSNNSGTKDSVQSISNVLSRFDLQAMTFSDNSAMYEYSLESAPEWTVVPDKFSGNDIARDCLVGLMRSMMWLCGSAETDPNVCEQRHWKRTYADVLTMFKIWEIRFAEYQDNLTPEQRGNPKEYAGNTLLVLSATVMRIFMGTAAGVYSEMAWDEYAEELKTIVDLAETLPTLRPTGSTPPSPAPTEPSKEPRRAAPIKTIYRPIAPKPNSTPPVTLEKKPPNGFTTFVFAQPPTPSSPSSSKPPSPPATPKPAEQPQDRDQHGTFSPSFELSPLVPLFAVSCRSRDPILRRRAIALLLASRRREGCWDSFGAAMIAMQCLRVEEEIPDHVQMVPGEILPMNPEIMGPSDIPEHKRVRNIYVSVAVAEGAIYATYDMTTGEKMPKKIVYEGQLAG